MVKKKQDLFQPLEKVTGVKKVIRCKSCGKKIEVGNFNRALCAECGYRGSRRKEFAKRMVKNRPAGEIIIGA